MDYSKKTRNELIELCKEDKIKGYSNKKKEDLITLLTQQITQITQTKETKQKSQTTATKATTAIKATKATKATKEKKEKKEIMRLNYIGSKYQLLDWLEENIRLKTGLTEFTNVRFADLFGGTGVVSHHFRNKGAIIQSNDAELYSSIITKAFTRSFYTEQCKTIISTLQKELDETEYDETVWFITEKYSPYDKNERMFFTVDNAQRIDYLRKRIEEIYEENKVSDDEYTFLLASLLLSADAVSNVPAVYGCYLKNFKAKAEKSLTLKPIHLQTNPKEVEEVTESETYNYDVLSDKLLTKIKAQITYLDPPYNERQYSKNYFPLNIIALTPEEQDELPELKGKTGIPQDCFMSDFCRKGKPVEAAFNTLFSKLDTEWIFLSYNSESLISKDKMIEIMKKYGEASVIERDYKRFKSFEYNNDKEIKEYLFCLRKYKKEQQQQQQQGQQQQQQQQQQKRKRPTVATS